MTLSVVVPPLSPPPDGATVDRRGLAAGTVAYALWGFFPAFWPLLEPAGATEILAHRVAWTFVLMTVVLTVLRGWGGLRRLRPRGRAMVAAAAALIAANWGVYIFAVTQGAVVEAALGYYVNPLVSVLLAVVVLRERLRRAQWAALAVAVVAVGVLTVGYGRVPYLALVLAVSFALYGLIKKTVPLPSTASLTAEGLALGPLAVGYLVWLQVTGGGTFTGGGLGHSPPLVAAGPATAAPLLLFGAAVRRIPLATLGLLFYLNPTLQLLWGVLVNHEPMPASRWIGFALVWAALVMFTVDALRSAHRDRQPVAPSLVAAPARAAVA